MDYLKFSKDKNAKLKAIKTWSPIKNPRVHSFIDVLVPIKKHNIRTHTTKENSILTHYKRSLLISC